MITSFKKLVKEERSVLKPAEINNLTACLQGEPPQLFQIIREVSYITLL